MYLYNVFLEREHSKNINISNTTIQNKISFKVPQPKIEIESKNVCFKVKKVIFINDKTCFVIEER